MCSITEWWILRVLALTDGVHSLCTRHCPFQRSKTCALMCAITPRLSLTESTSTPLLQFTLYQSSNTTRPVRSDRWESLLILRGARFIITHDRSTTVVEKKTTMNTEHTALQQHNTISKNTTQVVSAVPAR